MKKYEKLKEEILGYIQSKVEKIQEADKASRIFEVIEKIDEELVDKSDNAMRKLCKGKYFPTDAELNAYFENEA